MCFQVEKRKETFTSLLVTRMMIFSHSVSLVSSFAIINRLALCFKQLVANFPCSLVSTGSSLRKAVNTGNSDRSNAYVFSFIKVSMNGFMVEE